MTDRPTALRAMKDAKLPHVERNRIMGIPAHSLSDKECRIALYWALSRLSQIQAAANAPQS